MGIVTGYICLICLIFLLLKYIARRFHFDKLNKGLMKIHKYMACAFLLIGILHLILVIKVIDTRHYWVTASGIVVLFSGLALTVICHAMKNRKREIFFHRALSLIMAVMLVIHIVSYFYDFNQYKTMIRSITIDEIDLESIEDGAYIGECDAGYIYAKVKVVVENHCIKDIDILEHRHERGAKAESVVDVIVARQNIDVDAVSGATNSSLVIEKACVNALTR